MSKYRFIKPDMVRLALSDDDWIEIRKALTYGEQQKLMGAALKGVRSADEFSLDWERHSIARIEAWVLDWSFQDEQDKAVRVSRAAIAALDPDAAAEILAAIDRHVLALEEEKKARTGMSASVTS